VLLIAGAALGPTHVLAGYLAKTEALSKESAHNEPIWLLIVSIVIAIGGFAIGAMWAKSGSATTGLMANIGKNRLYIDWAYSKFIVLPLEFLPVYWPGKMFTSSILWQRESPAFQELLVWLDNDIKMVVYRPTRS
jgi:hypothetical protein